MSSRISVKVEYFAVLREQRGLSSESRLTECESPQDLYHELAREHGFRLPLRDLKVAVNGEFGQFSQTLSDGDTVVFIPPVAGG